MTKIKLTISYDDKGMEEFPVEAHISKIINFGNSVLDHDQYLEAFEKVSSEFLSKSLELLNQMICDYCNGEIEESKNRFDKLWNKLETGELKLALYTSTKGEIEDGS